MASPVKETWAPDRAGGTDLPGEPPPARQATRAELGDWTLVAITAAVTLPLVWLGYGSDLDIGDVRRTGALVRDLDYFPSRNPGVPVFEAIVAVLDPLGHVALNLATAAAAAAAVVAIARLVRAWGHENGDLVALAFLASPVTLIAGTSATDFMWAVAFLLWGVLAHVRDRSLAAGLLLALAVGSRSSTAGLVVAFMVADAWVPARRPRAARTLAVFVPLALALYVPSWLAHDRSVGAMLDHTSGWRGLVNNLGRFTYKNYTVAGMALVIVVLVALPALLRALRRWNRDPLVRFSVLGLAVSEAVFFQLPWKWAHLLPAIAMFVLWVAASDRNRRPFLWLLIGAVALNGVVALRLAAPDDPDQSRSANFGAAVGLGLLANDVRCRVRFMDEEPEMNSGAWACTLVPMRGPTAPADTLTDPMGLG